MVKVNLTKNQITMIIIDLESYIQEIGLPDHEAKVERILKRLRESVSKRKED
jgi:hypothetical protein